MAKKSNTLLAIGQLTTSGEDFMEPRQIHGLENQLRTSLGDILGYAQFSERDDQYVRFLTKLALENSSIAFGNANAVHAVTVFSLMFQQAQSEINLYAGNLNGQISAQADYQYALNMFLASRKNGVLNILLQEYDENNKPPLFRLLKYYQEQNPSQIRIKQIENSCELTSVDYHFCVVDSKMYRLETDKIEYKAIGCFNDKNGIAKELNERFLNCFKKSNKLIHA